MKRIDSDYFAEGELPCGLSKAHAGGVVMLVFYCNPVLVFARLHR